MTTIAPAEPDRRTDGERRTTESAVWLDMRHSTRRVSPAVGEHAIQECARLRNALAVSEALLEDCRDSLTSAREECARLREVNKELLTVLQMISSLSTIPASNQQARAQTIDYLQRQLIACVRQARAAIAKAAQA